MENLHVNEERLLTDLKELAQIGATPQGGVSRPALSPADMEAREWFKARILKEGFVYEEDGAGNQSAVLPAENPRRLIAGSHLDTVPDGGRFDGALGTLAAFEALRSIRDAGLSLPISLEAISFTDEEGTLMGLLGSRAINGHLSERDFRNPRGGPGYLAEAMARADLTEAGMLSAKRSNVAAFVELHIEQGTRLEETETHIGVVTSIVGIRSQMLTFTGMAAHAGTTSMLQRRDALWGAVDFVRDARQLVMDRYTPGVVNFGIIEARPGAFNIVPAEVSLALEFRHGSRSEMDHMEEDLHKLAKAAAKRHDLGLSYEKAADIYPAPMSSQVIEAIEAACGDLGLRHTRLMSFAGHDTQAVATIAPAAMLFVPSVKGISHNPLEYTRDADVVNGANVVLHTLLKLARTIS